jgi:phosphohistidine swiveling domain-containing protein
MRARKRAIAKKHNFSNKILCIAHALSYSIWWQDHRKGVAWWLNNFTDILSKQAIKVYNLNFDSIMYYTGEEWRDLLVLGKKVPKDIINARKQYVVFDAHSGRYCSYIKKSAHAIMRPIIKSTKQKTDGVVTGTVVSKGSGVISGVVRVLHSPKHADKMKQGEILIAPMTSPDYIVVMRKASAIVTDVGGLMSHAAVVSRELGIPCIVGTKIATQILKDGDKIEVDAEKGIIKKI